MKVFKLFLFLLAMAIFGCKKAEVKPVDLYPEDICAHCKMAISNRAFAGEIVKEDGETLKFDDLGCLRAAMKNEEVPRGAHLFVRAMEKEEWLKAEDATLVKSSMIQTPMGSGMIAFADRKNAENFVKQHGGEIVSLETFLKGKSFHEN
jgi:copper chaperone NosL